MTREEQAVLQVVTGFLDSYAKQDVEACMAVISESKPILMLGTNVNEVFTTAREIRDALMRDFDCMSSIRWGKHRNFHVEAAATLASVILELPISYQHDGQKVETLFRYGLTLAQEADQWKICSSLTSVPFGVGTYSFSE